MEYNTFGRFKKDSKIHDIDPKKLQRMESKIYHKHESFVVTENKKSLASHEQVLKLAKISMPIFLIFTEGILMYTNFYVGASIEAYTSITNTYIPVFDIQFFPIVVSLWKENQYFMSFMLCVCSGILPHVKTILMTFCWFSPQKYLNFKWREYILLFLDGFSKWGYINTYLILIYMNSFRYSVFQNRETFQIAITPQPIFYLFIAVSMIQNIMTHVMLHQHRQSVEIDSNEEKQILVEAHLELYEKKTIIGHEGGFFKKYVVPVILTLGIIIFMVAYFMKCYDFIYQGLVGAITFENPKNSYSPWDVGYNLPANSYYPKHFLIIFLQVLFILTTFVTPFIFLIFTLVLFTVPMTIKSQNYIYYITEVLFSWSSIEVFAFSCFSTVVEIQPFVRISLGNSLDGADQIVELLHQMFPQVITFDQVYQVDAYMIKSSLPLFVLIFLILFIGIYVLRLAQFEVEGKLVDIGIRKQDAWKQNKKYFQHDELEESDKQSNVEPLLNVQQSAKENSNLPNSELGMEI